ncbi:MAG TPA: hypothetical protein DCS93_13470 [Microscillaceae bacterium]|nr:hypothetical protein [Microscillaceae bacterium]
MPSPIVDQRSQETKELIDKMPHWLIRWGITLFLFIGLFFLAISLMIEYPDTLQERVIIKKNTLAKNSTFTGEMYISQSFLHQLTAGQPVKLSLVSYPANIYGSLQATVQHIGQEARPKDYRFKVTLKLPNQGKTSLGKTIHYKHLLLARGEIVLQKRTLFKRLFSL